MIKPSERGWRPLQGNRSRSGHQMISVFRWGVNARCSNTRFAPWSPRHPLASESTRQRAFAVVGRSGQARHLPLPTPDPAGAEVRGGGSSGVCQRPAGSPASALGGPRQKRGHDQPSAGCERLAAASAGMGVRRVIRSESHASSNAWRSSPMSCLQGIIRLDSLRSVTLRNSASKL